MSSSATAGGGTDTAGAALMRLAKEQTLVTKKPVPGVRFEPGGDTNPLEWRMFVDAPDEYVVNGGSRACPYRGVSFPVSMKFPVNYPFKHPDMRFQPGQLYHPNVNRETGEICADTITKTFGPTKNVTDLAKLVQQFLAMPNLESPLDQDAAIEIREQIATYEDKARKAAVQAPKKSQA